MDDVSTAANLLRGYTALYVGGMGSKDKNFYNALACRMGFEAEAARVQELYLAKQHRDAGEAVPEAFIDATSLIGPIGRIRERLHAFADAGVTTLTITPAALALEHRIAILRGMAQALEQEGLAS
jgi:hypothetical protein